MLDFLDKRFSLIAAVGSLGMALCMYLETQTLRSIWWAWASIFAIAIPLGTYIIRAGGLHKDDLFKGTPYQKLKGLRLKAAKWGLILLIMIGITVTMGSYLNLLILGGNYLFQGKEQMERFEIVELSARSPLFSKRSKRKVPNLVIRNATLKDEVRINELNFDEFDAEQTYIDIQTYKGLLGWSVVKAYVVDKK
ncbi:MAG: hypothetical protein AAF990_02425 [Bacteroidota bacterium]